MAVDPTELKAQLDVATAEIQALKESAQKQKAEWEQKLKDESYGQTSQQNSPGK